MRKDRREDEEEAQGITRSKTSERRPRKAELDRLVEEAIVDCYNESEQASGLHTMIEDNLRLPFETQILGVRVSIVAVGGLVVFAFWIVWRYNRCVFPQRYANWDRILHVPAMWACLAIAGADPVLTGWG